MIKHLIMTNNPTRSSELNEEQRARCHDFTEHSSAIWAVAAVPDKRHGAASEGERRNVLSRQTATQHNTMHKLSTYDKSINTMHNTSATSCYSTQ
jgi:hypothetical protein